MPTPSKKPKLGRTEKRFAWRIALPVAIAAGIGYIASLYMQVAWYDKNVEDGYRLAPNGEAQTPLARLSKEENIVILEQATQSLNAAYEKQVETDPPTAQEQAQIEQQRNEVEIAVQGLANADERQWRNMLKNAYEEVNAYARIIGVNETVSPPDDRAENS